MDTPQRTLHRMTWTLGLAGLLPFVGLAVLAWLGDPAARASVALAQLRYGALILTFVGALHWGAVLVARDLNTTRVALALAWSVIPALYAWRALYLPDGRALAALAIGLVIAWVVDLVLYGHHASPHLGWFMRLRAVLTAVGAGSLVATALALTARG